MLIRLCFDQGNLVSHRIRSLVRYLFDSIIKMLQHACYVCVKYAYIWHWKNGVNIILYALHIVCLTMNSTFLYSIYVSFSASSKTFEFVLYTYISELFLVNMFFKHKNCNKLPRNCKIYYKTKLKFIKTNLWTGKNYENLP